MALLTPSHDVWLAILDSMSDEDRPQLKQCNLVCHSWHVYLRPRLMASVKFHELHHPHSSEDLQSLERCGHLMRRLCNENWDPSKWLFGFIRTLTNQSLASTSPRTVPFSALVELKLHMITFSTFKDLHACISLISSTLERLTIIECECVDAYEIKKELEYLKSPDSNTVFQTHELALAKVEIDSDQANYFASIMCLWFALSPTLRALRVIHVRLETFDEYDLRTLFNLLNCPECLAEELNLDLVERYISDGPLSSLVCQSLTKLSVISRETAAGSRALDILNDSILPSLRSLHITVEADDDDETRLKTCRDWRQHYPSLTSAHFVFTSWPPGHALDWTSTVQKTVNTSDFLNYCAKLQILSLDVYECTYEKISAENERHGPNYTWTNKEHATV